MATYAIGDLQGCYDELLDLLNHINFNERRDRLWLAGDLVNRGPQSLECLRFARRLDSNLICVLGNHDLTLLAIDAGVLEPRKSDTVDTILAARDRPELMDWLRQRPLLHYDKSPGYLLAHAGLPPQWDRHQALELAGEVEKRLRGDKAEKLYENMYGNQPDLWSDDLRGHDRRRFIINCLTRMRYCDSDGRLDLRDSSPPGRQSRYLIPWFQLQQRRSRKTPVVFGHWASLTFGELEDFARWNVYPLDTGCVWGHRLTAMRLEDKQLFSVPSRQKQAR